jgi:hypothetical protein
VSVAPSIRDAIRVLRSVRFDDQPSLEADEIHDVGWNDVLPAKLEIWHSAIAQHGPQATLGRRRVRTHLSRPIAEFSGALTVVI